MKKLFITTVILFALIAGFDFFSRHYLPGQSFQAQVDNLVKNQPVLNDIQKQVATPGALRIPGKSQDGYLTRAGTIDETNSQRTQNGLPMLKENMLLDKAALAKVQDMFDYQYFEHISPTGKGPAGLAKDVGYDYIAIGENLALGNFENNHALLVAWMNSPGHRANILNDKYQEIGVAVLKGMFEGHTTWLAVQEFGKPASSCPSVDAGLKSQITSYKTEVDSLISQINALKAYLDSASPSNQQEVDSYNQKVAQFNDLVKVYNNRVDVLKQLTAQYNGQVSAYNACLGN